MALSYKPSLVDGATHRAGGALQLCPAYCEPWMPMGTEVLVPVSSSRTQRLPWVLWASKTTVRCRRCILDQYGHIIWDLLFLHLCFLACEATERNLLVPHQAVT